MKRPTLLAAADWAVGRHTISDTRAEATHLATISLGRTNDRGRTAAEGGYPR
jgi:hypothetical protein